MNQAPFTFEIATEICEDFEDLRHTKFKPTPELNLKIEEIFIVPYSQEDQQTFINSYMETSDHSHSIAFYNGQDFNVLLWTIDIADPERRYPITITEFIANRGIKYNFPGSD